MLTKSDVNIDDMTIEDYRKNIIGLFVELNLGNTQFLNIFVYKVEGEMIDIHKKSRFVQNKC